jgi:hypothetical protein
MRMLGCTTYDTEVQLCTTCSSLTLLCIYPRNAFEMLLIWEPVSAQRSLWAVEVQTSWLVIAGSFSFYHAVSTRAYASIEGRKTRKEGKLAGDKDDLDEADLYWHYTTSMRDSPFSLVPVGTCLPGAT